MAFQNKKPIETKELLGSEQGWTYVDVRTAEEFQQGHVPGALNVPVAQPDAMGRMSPNPDFLPVMKKLFPVDAKLILGCAAGGRSAAACNLLSANGYSTLVNMHGGFHGARDPSGRVTEPGWQACGFPVETKSSELQSWHSLKLKK